ncbi:MAG: alpha/beta hydrolase [Chitinophagaceae bacterium]
MNEIKHGDATIRYVITGNGAITLLFVHGSYIDQSYWKDQVAFFNRDYTVVTFDLPGHGVSGRERQHWSMQGFAEDVVALIKKLDLKNVILIGHSIGADINLMAANQYAGPIIGFIAIDIFKNAAMPLSEDYQQQAAGIKAKLETDFAPTNEAYARMALLTPATPAIIAERVVQAYRNAWAPMAIATTPEIFTMFQVERELLPKLAFKLYLINVDYTPADENALREYAGSGYQLFHMDGTCHYPMLEHPETLNTLLKEAIENIGTLTGISSK